MRVSRADIANSMVKIFDDSEKKSSIEENLVFTMFGQHDEMVDEYGKPDSKGFPLLWDLEDKGRITQARDREEAMAEILIVNGVRKYYVKRNSSGRLFSPYQIVPDSPSQKERHHATNEQFRFREVSNNVFMLYLQFLKTKNVNWIKQAQKEMA